MAAPTVQELLDGVETQLKTIAGLRVTTFSPGQVNVPAAIVTVPPIDYRRAYGAKRWRLDLTIVVLVSATLDRAGQRALAEYADHTGAKSLFAAFAGPVGQGVDLGIAGTTCWLTNFEPLGWEQVGQLGYYGGTWTGAIEASGV